jgi:hypothetical protein
MAGPPDRVAEANQAAVALFSAIVAVALAAVGFLLRFGFQDNSPVEWAKYVGLSWFLVSFSLIARRLLAAGTGGRVGRWWSSHGFLTLFGLAVAAGFGMPAVALGKTAGAVLCVVGVGGFLLALATRGSRGARRGLVLLIAFAGLFSIYAAGAAWGTGDRNPLFVEDICFGRASIDTLFHASICNMLRTYGVHGTGLDGLPSLQYHFGSHWIFARLCNLLDVRVIDLYNRGYPVVFIPFGVLSLGTAALGLAQRARGGGARTTNDASEPRSIGVVFWLILLVGYIGFLPYASNFMPINGWNSIITSESYGLAVAVSLLLVAAVWSFVGDVFFSGGRSRIADLVVGALLLAALVGAIGLLKISVMLVLAASAGYLVWRLRLFRSLALDLLALGVILTASVAYQATADPGYFALGESRFIPFGFPRANIEPQWWPEFWLIYYAWIWVLAAVRLRQEGIRTVGDLSAAWRGRKLLDLEFVVVAALFGAAPGLIMKYSSTHYFSNYQQWLALALLLSIVARRARNAEKGADETGDPVNAAAQDRPAVGRSSLGQLSLRRVFAALLLLTLGGTLVSNTAVLSEAMVGANLAARGHAAGQTGFGVALMHGQFEAAADIVRQTAAGVQSRLNSDKRILVVLSSLDQLPLAEKRQTLLFIPKSNRQFWDLLHGPYSPKDGPFVGPALSGLAMIDGLYSPSKDEPWIGHGYNSYPRPAASHAQPPVSQYLPALRKRCAELGFKKLIVIDADSSGAPITLKFDCP